MGRTMSGHGRHPADHLRRRPRGRAARPLDVPAAEEVPRPRTARRARQRRLPLRGRQFHVREGRRGRRAVRLVALRRPRLPVPEALGRDRFPRARRHAHHVRRDPRRLLEAARTPRRHGRQPHRGVDLLPEHAAPLLRPDVLRARGPRPRAAVRAGVQRLDHRRVVRGRRQGPAHPARAAAALGRRPLRAGDPAVREQRLLRGHVPGEPVPARSAVDPRQGQALGPGVRRVPGHRDRHLHAHRFELEDADHVARRAVHRELHAHVLERDGLDGRLHLLRHVGALPEPDARVQRGAGRLDALRDGTCRQAVGGAERQLVRHRACPSGRRAT